MKKRILPPDVLIEETFKEMGYRPDKISPMAKVPVLVRCSVTGEVHERILGRLWMNKSIKNTGRYISQRGALIKIREGKTSQPTTRRFNIVPLPTNVDIELTLFHFGYDPRELGAWSRKYVVVFCPIAQDFFRVRREHFNYSKSVRENGVHIVRSIIGKNKIRKLNV